MMLCFALLAIAFVPMLAEAAIASRHDRALRARGATEPAADVYRVMQIAYPVCFLVMVAEAWLRDAGVDGIFLAGAAVFAAAKALKYWAIATLGERWTFRVLVPPGSALVRNGPYRWLRHPNYVGVAGELAGFAVMAQAAFTGVAALMIFVLLMLARVRVEEQALGIRE